MVQQASFRRSDAVVAAAVVIAAIAIAMGAMRAYRAAGVQPFFYQQNFAPAVMMACGHGFVMPAGDGAPPGLQAFLALEADRFDCRQLAASPRVTPVEWNAGWYYLYAAAAVTWRVTGISWPSLDLLVALMNGLVAAALYGLFRLVASQWMAVVTALLLVLSPGNLTHLLSLRDYSKAPFSLAAILMLAVLVLRPMRPAAAVGLAALCGAVLGFGWGFRGDLVVLVPFALMVALALLPGPIRPNAPRNALAAAAILAGFLAAAWPMRTGFRPSGGCQFHQALLGMTTPVAHELGMAPSFYQFSDQFLDTSIAVRVSDYSVRLLGAPAAVLCSPEYEAASRQLYLRLVQTFPADVLAHVYGSILSILRSGFELSAPPQAPLPFGSDSWAAWSYHLVGRATAAVSPAGPVIVLAAIGGTWVTSTRLAVALTSFVLFLAGYPAIEFEERHWFHLRFIPWFAALIVVMAIAGGRLSGWTSAQWLRTAAGAAVVVVVLVAGLIAARFVQSRSVHALVGHYQSAAFQPIPISHLDGAFVRIDWQFRDQPPASDHLDSALLAVTLDPGHCGGSAPVSIRARYEADDPSHDLSTTMAVEPLSSGSGPQLFLPVFSSATGGHAHLRFAGFDVIGAPAACVLRVDRLIDHAGLPLWLQVQVPSDWSRATPYQSLRTPRVFRW